MGSRISYLLYKIFTQFFKTAITKRLQFTPVGLYAH